MFVVNISQLLHAFIHSIGWDFSVADLRRYAEAEAEFQKMVGGGPVGLADIHRRLPAKLRIERMEDLSLALAGAEQTKPS